MNISVYITSYNQKHYLIDAIESVLAQTLRPSQVIIIDDCSTDGSQEVIAGYAARYPELVTPIFHERNLGIARTRSDALQAVTGDYVTYVDGDDRFLPTKLEKEASKVDQDRHVQIVYSNFYYIAPDGRHLADWAGRDTPPQGDVFPQVFAREFPRRTLYRNELVDYRAWKHFGFYDPELRTYEDYDMKIRLSKYLKVAYYAEALTEYRTHELGLSRSSSAIQHLHALEHIRKKNTILLEGMELSVRKDIEHKFGNWITPVVRQAVVEALADQQNPRESRQRAFGYFFRLLAYNPSFADIALGVRILLPNSLYSRTSVIYRRATAVASRTGHR